MDNDDNRDLNDEKNLPSRLRSNSTGAIDDQSINFLRSEQEMNDETNKDIENINENNQNNTDFMPGPLVGDLKSALSSSRRSSTVSIKRTSQSRSPPPQMTIENINAIAETLKCGSGNQILNPGFEIDDPNEMSNDQCPNSDSITDQALAQAVVNAILMQKQYSSSRSTIRRSGSAATSYMASDEDNIDDEDLDDKKSNTYISKENTKNAHNNLNSKNIGRKKRSLKVNIPTSSNQESFKSTSSENYHRHGQESSGYGASIFSITSSGRSSAQTNGKMHSSSSRTVRIAPESDNVPSGSVKHENNSDQEDGSAEKKSKGTHKSKKFSNFWPKLSESQTCPDYPIETCSSWSRTRRSLPCHLQPMKNSTPSNFNNMMDSSTGQNKTDVNTTMNDTDLKNDDAKSEFQPITNPVRSNSLNGSSSSNHPNILTNYHKDLQIMQKNSLRNPTNLPHQQDCFYYSDQHGQFHENHRDSLCYCCSNTDIDSFYTCPSGNNSSTCNNTKKSASFSSSSHHHPHHHFDEQKGHKNKKHHHNYRNSNHHHHAKSSSSSNGNGGCGGVLKNGHDNSNHHYRHSPSSEDEQIYPESSSRQTSHNQYHSHHEYGQNHYYGTKKKHTSKDSTDLSSDYKFFSPCHQSDKNSRKGSNSTNGYGRSTSRKVSLILDGNRFQIDIDLLKARSDTMLGRMFSSEFEESRRQSIDDIHLTNHLGLTPTLFSTILDYYRIGRMTCPPGVNIQELKEACDFFLIPFNHNTVRCGNIRALLHELSNEGAYQLFERFLEIHILPKLVECTQQGERECHLVILLDEEVIDWDEDFPPQLPDDEMNSHLIYHTQMLKFLKYVENREIAKQVLSDRGLKKIRIGIEGYPTNKERIKYRAGIRSEIIYNYAQRPFIRMSWEEEENKSRHVDFQCVKSKSVNDLTNVDAELVEPIPTVSAVALASSDILQADVLLNHEDVDSPGAQIRSSPPSQQDIQLDARDPTCQLPGELILDSIDMTAASPTPTNNNNGSVNIDNAASDNIVREIDPAGNIPTNNILLLSNVHPTPIPTANNTPPILLNEDSIVTDDDDDEEEAEKNTLNEERPFGP